MGVSAESLGASAPAWTAESEGGAVPLALSASARRVFLIWTAVFWGGVGVFRLHRLELALVWTQYQYFVFPLIFGVWGFHLLREDLRRCDPREGDADA